MRSLPRDLMAISSSAAPATSSRCTRLVARVLKMYEDVQVSGRGKYSLERLQSLEEYCRTTPRWRVALVLIATPLPALAVTLLLESVPLAPPSARPMQNYRFWLRFFVTVTCAGLSNLLRARTWLPELSLSRSRVFAIASVAAALMVAYGMALSSVWVFPIPFTALFMSTPMLFVWLAGLYVTVGPRVLTDVEGFRFRALQYFNLIGVEGSLMVLYPAYQAVFVSLRPEIQPAFVFVLPLLKVALKNKVAQYASHCEDFLPETVAFTVEFFNALYNIVCMQNAGSKWIMLLIIANDVVFTALSLRKIYNRTDIAQQFHRQYHQELDGQLDLLATILHLAHHPDELDHTSLQQIRLRACAQHKLSRAGSKMLETLEERKVYWSQRSYTHQQLLDAQRQRMLSWKGSATIAPAPSDDSHTSNPVTPTRVTIVREQAAATATTFKSVFVVPLQRMRTAPRRSSITADQALTQIQKTRIVHDNLQLLFQCEYIALVEYIECVAPMLYAIYLPVLCALPNGQFFPNTRDLAPDAVRTLIINIIGYGALEVASLVTLHSILKRKFAFSSLYQIAFVLETQTVLVQGKLIVWLLFALQFTLDHLGTFTCLDIPSLPLSAHLLWRVVSRRGLHIPVCLARLASASDVEDDEATRARH